jgi:hypothetical protein
LSIFAMSQLPPSQVVVAENVLLDGRLALFHRRQGWLAVADLHFGYELSQRAAGNLFPLWGMQTIEARLNELLADYKPRRLIILGDLGRDGLVSIGLEPSLALFPATDFSGTGILPVICNIGKMPMPLTIRSCNADSASL